MGGPQQPKILLCKWNTPVWTRADLSTNLERSSGTSRAKRPESETPEHTLPAASTGIHVWSPVPGSISTSARDSYPASKGPGCRCRCEECSARRISFQLQVQQEIRTKGYLQPYCGVQRRPARLTIHSTEAGNSEQ